MPTPKQIEMIEKYQCPGCICGSDTTCEKFDFHENQNEHFFRCNGHYPGTTFITNRGPQLVMLGLPNGFNNCRRLDSIDNKGTCLPYIRLFVQPPHYNYNPFDVPVWAKEKDNDVIVKVYSPRTLVTAIEIFADAKISDLHLQEGMSPPVNVDNLEALQ